MQIAGERPTRFRGPTVSHDGDGRDAIGPAGPGTDGASQKQPVAGNYLYGRHLAGEPIRDTFDVTLGNGKLRVGGHQDRDGRAAVRLIESFRAIDEDFAVELDQLAGLPDFLRFARDSRDLDAQLAAWRRDEAIRARTEVGCTGRAEIAHRAKPVDVDVEVFGTHIRETSERAQGIQITHRHPSSCACDPGHH